VPQVRADSIGPWRQVERDERGLIKVRLVCGDCYEEIKSKNALGTEGIKSVQ